MDTNNTNTNTNVKQFIFNRSYIGTVATNMMMAGKVGDVLTIEAIEQAGGGKLNPGVLASARKRCAKQTGLVWEIIRGARAIKCCNGSEVLGITESYVERIHRAAKRGKEKASLVKVSELSQDQVTKHLTISAQLGTMEVFSKRSMTKALETRNVSAPLDMQKLLSQF